MKLKEIKGLFDIDYGAPEPILVANDRNLFLAFYSDKENLSPYPVERNDRNDTGVIILQFYHFAYFRFGIPNDEVVVGHPYYKLGLNAGGFFELIDSDLIKQLNEIERIHPRNNSSVFDGFKHYILTFKENMFECVSKSFEMRKKNTTMCDQSFAMLNELWGK